MAAGSRCGCGWPSRGRGPSCSRSAARASGWARGGLGGASGGWVGGTPGRHYPGLGLGLYITRQIVTALEGTISVESAPGQGSVFTVMLPRARAEVGPDTPVLEELGARQGVRGA